MNRLSLTQGCVGILAAVVLAACNMTSPSYINTAEIDMRQEQIHEVIPFVQVDDETITLVADHYTRHGVGPMDVTLTYPAGGNAGVAGTEVRQVASLLRAHGVDDLNLATLPIGAGGKTGEVLLSYTSVSAHPPKGCSAMPGDDRALISQNKDGQYPDYRFGCGVDSYIAQQVARPKDLLGDKQMGEASGDRAAARMKGYRTGEDFKDLKGTTASEAK